MSWTDERVELLKKLWSEGLSSGVIASRMGDMTRNAVIGKVNRLRLPAPRIRKIRIPIIPRTLPKDVTVHPVLNQSPVTLMDLREQMCRWPLGDPGREEFRFCGAQSQPSCPYCAHHSEIAYHREKKPGQ